MFFAGKRKETIRKTIQHLLTDTSSFHHVDIRLAGKSFEEMKMCD